MATPLYFQMDKQLLDIIQLEAPTNWKVEKVLNLRYQHSERLNELRGVFERGEAGKIEQHLFDAMNRDIEMHKSVLAEIADVLSGLEQERSAKQLEMDFSEEIDNATASTD